MSVLLEALSASAQRRLSQKQLKGSPYVAM